MKKLPRILWGTAILLIPLALLARAADDPTPGSGPGDGESRPVHLDARVLEEGVLEATRGFLREDVAAFRAGLSRIAGATRQLDREADAVYGSDLIIYDQAFRVTLNRAREYSARGDLENAFHQFAWLQRACVTCHELAREQGWLPPREGPDGGTE